MAVASGCGGARSGSASAAPVVVLTERDFAIDAPKVVTAGEVVFRVRNDGPDAHELLVVRAPNGDLPMRSDGLTLDEERLQQSEVGVLEPAESYAVRELRLRLSPGRYVLFCNMSGHYIGGMHQTLVVR
ncbi:MAG: hypothetical protein H0X39_19385 [Actinobacteria bacterium]|nr:hypothetical protein [Actinomycetota bacterium]